MVFWKKSGNASRLIFGEKGIGKSSALTLSTMAVWLAYKNVIPIYVEYIGGAEDFKSPRELFAEALKLETEASLSKCLVELRRIDKFALIIVDEIEQVYESTSASEKRRQILDDLAELGSQISGRAYTYACGSSSLTPSLITKNAIHHSYLSKEFPMLNNAPNLNGKKFASFRLHRGCHFEQDFETIRKVYNITPEMMNWLYFLCGSNLRTIDTVHGKLLAEAQTCDISNVANMSTDSLRSLREYCFPPAMWDKRAENTLKEYGHLIKELYEKLVGKNQHLLKRINHEGNNLGSIHWMKEVEPLYQHEITAICVKLGFDYLVINHLIDKGYFSGPPDLQYLHADKPADLLHHFQQNEARRWIWIPFLFQSAKPKADAMFDACFTAVASQLLKDYILKTAQAVGDKISDFSSMN